MARQIRVQLQGATYHVFSRGNRRSRVFGRPEDYEAYLEDLRTLSEQHGAKVLAFCLMPNHHPHLVLRTDGDPLSVLMQRLTQRHAIRYNRSHRVRGRLNESRYKARLVDGGRYLVSLVRYIHQNPVRARLATSPEAWGYSSHLAYLGAAYPWVEVNDLLARLGGRDAYQELMQRRQAKEERELFEKPGLLEPPEEVGDLALIGVHRFDRGPWLARAPSQPLEEALAEEAARLGVEVCELAGRGREERLRSARRRVAARLRARGYRLHEIARGLGREEAAICRLLQRTAGAGEPEAEEFAQLELLPVDPGNRASEEPATYERSAA